MKDFKMMSFSTSKKKPFPPEEAPMNWRRRRRRRGTKVLSLKLSILA